MFAGFVAGARYTVHWSTDTTVPVSVASFINLEVAAHGSFVRASPFISPNNISKFDTCGRIVREVECNILVPT